MDRITKLEKQKGPVNRISVYISDQFCVGISSKAVRDLELVAGREVTPDLRYQITRIAAWESALMSLARREHSRAEVVRKLKQKGFDGEIIAHVCDELEKRKYIDDRRFARLWIERRKAYHPRGRRMLALELEQKGVAPDLAREALDEHFPEDDERKALIELIGKRRRMSSHHKPDVFKRRLMGFLARRGFSYDDIRRTLAEHFPDL